MEFSEKDLAEAAQGEQPRPSLPGGRRKRHDVLIGMAVEMPDQGGPLAVALQPQQIAAQMAEQMRAAEQLALAQRQMQAGGMLLPAAMPHPGEPSDPFGQFDDHTLFTTPRDADKYKTELCRNWMQTGACPYNDRCQFAHSSGLS